MKTDFETLKALSTHTINHLKQAEMIDFAADSRADLIEAMATEFGVSFATDENIKEQAIEEVEAALKGMLKPIYEERELGRAEIRALFRSSKVGNIAGCLVQSGIIRRNAKARLLRDSVVVAENLTVSSLRREKDDVTEVREGFECGLTLTYSDIKEGDVIETYELVEKERV